MTHESSKAVFLSYASQDAEAARRVAEALRGFGLEVWFDQNELRGGDAWDAHIRTQIKTCALFLPFISANTQAREEGYFRREWKLAVDRTHDMAGTRAFILPIVVDGTPENEATVPTEFMSYQWTRLTGGEPTPDFVTRIKQLLEAPRAATTPTATPTFAPTSTSPPPAARKSRTPLLLGIIALVAVAALAFAWLGRLPPLSNSDLPAATRSTAPDKSIAVLPFANMSDEKDSAYFTDGIHEDVLTKLAVIRDLHVISRTSVMQYRDRKESVREIAQQLGVTYILEGSVRRAGNKIRVTGQLIRAATDEHVWASSYDRDLSDVFAIQSELATAIATALSTVLSPAEQQLVAQRPTENIAAYDAFTKARQILQSGYQAGFSDLEPLLKTAVLLDPKFAQAWAELGSVYARRYFDNWDRTPECLARAKEAIDQAVALAPTDPVVIQKLGDYHYYGYRDYDRAAAQYLQLTRDSPNFAPAFASLAFIHRRQGHWNEAMTELRRAVQLEPRNRRYLAALGETALALRLYNEATEAFQQFQVQAPDDFYGQRQLAQTALRARGSLVEFRAMLDRLVRDNASPFFQMRIASVFGDLDMLASLNRAWLQETDLTTAAWDDLIDSAEVLWLHGDIEEARKQAARAVELGRPKVEAMQSERDWLQLAEGYTVMGNKDEALRCAERARALLPESEDAWDGPNVSDAIAKVLAWNGETERALDALAQSLRTPNGVNVHFLRTSVFWRVLRDDPRFIALVNDPKNNEPLL